MVTYFGKIEDDDIINLTITQRRVVLMMEKQQLYLVHTEGNQVICWLETENKKQVMKVRKNTVNALLNKKVIVFDNQLSNEKTDYYYYYNRLSKDYLTRLENLRKRKKIYW